MNVGDKITFPFGKDEKEGTVVKIFPKTVYIRVDFAKHKGKIIKRSIIEVQPGKEAKKDEKKKKEEKKQGVTKKEAKKKEKEKKKTKAAKEDRKKEKAAKKSAR